MADERIDIEIHDKISSGIRKKLNSIATGARKAHGQVKKLASQLKLTSSSMNTLTAASNKVSTSLIKEKVATEKLTQQKIKTKAETQKLAQQNLKLAAATDKLAQSKLMTMQRTEQLSAAQSRATAASKRAAIADIRHAQAKKNLAKNTNVASSAMGGFVQRLGGAVALGFGAIAAVRAADSYTLLQNKLRQVVETEEQLVLVTEKIFDVANKTRSPVAETAQAFQRFDMALKQLGASQEESLRLTESVNKALVISGAATSEQRAALLQLSQAFNKGKLDGDEFRTVMELMPTVADAIAKQLGVTRGELLKLAPQGKITAEVMRNAFANAADDIDQKFGKAIPSVGQSLTVMGNSMIKRLGEMDKMFGLTDKLSRGIIFLANNMDVLAVATSAVGSSMLAAFGPKLLLMFGAATKAVWGFTAAIAANPIGLLAVGISTAATTLAVFRDDIKLTADGTVSLGDVMRAVTSDTMTWWGEVWQEFRKDSGKSLTQSEKDQQSWLSFSGNIFDAALSNAKEYTNKKIAFFVGGYGAIKKLWEQWPTALKGIGVLALNESVSIVEGIVNASTAGIRNLLDTANSVAQKLGRDPIFDSDLLKIDLSELKREVPKELGELGQSMMDEFRNAFDTDFIGSEVDSVLSRAKKISATRASVGTGGSGALRPADPSKEGQAAAKTRAQGMAMVNEQLQTELNLMKMTSQERAIEERLISTTNELKRQGTTISSAESDLIREQISLIEQERQLMTARNQIEADSWQQKLANISEGYSQVDKMRKRDLLTEEQASQAKAKLWRDEQNIKLQAADTFFSNMSQLQSSQNKKLARVGKAAAIASALISTYKGAAAAFADTPGPIWVRAAASGSAVIAGLAQVDAIRNQGNFANGGIIGGNSYTGDHLTANVNSGEMIINRQQQKTLFNMANNQPTQSPQPQAQTSSSSVQMNFTVINNSSGVTVEQKQVGENEVVAIINDIVPSMIDTRSPRAVASDIDNPNGFAARSIDRNFNSERQRR